MDNFLIEDELSCPITCEALLFEPETDENPSDSLSETAISRVVISTAALLGLAMTGSAISSTGTASGFVASIQSEGIDAAESAEESLDSTMRRDKAAITVMTSMRSFAEFKNIWQMISGRMRPYIGGGPRVLTIFFKILLL